MQFFLTDPQSYAAPMPAATQPTRAGPRDVEVYIHSPYRLNVATTNNRIRIPSRKLLVQHAQAAAEIGAKGLIVHGGHVNTGDDARSASTTGARPSRGRTAASRCRS